MDPLLGRRSLEIDESAKQLVELDQPEIRPGLDLVNQLSEPETVDVSAPFEHTSIERVIQTVPVGNGNPKQTCGF